mgnify:FL=1
MVSTWQIAYRFFQNDWRRYIAFLASTAFTVMVYFLYTALIRHPDLQGGYAYAAAAVKGMKAAAVVIAIFAFLFLLYSSSSFARLRMKEFGLLSLFGVSKGQLARIILGEHLIIAVASVTAGLGMGFLLLKLFFMGISALLRLPEELRLSAKADVWLHTITVFGGMFAAVVICSLRMVLGRTVVELVRFARKPKATPRFSFWRLVLGLLLVVGGYLWASSSNPMTIISGVVPVTLIVSVGTVILMREASIACLSWLHDCDRLYYRPVPFLTVSQLAYKIQDNYRILAAVAILVAVILSAVGTILTVYALSVEDAETSYPVPIQLVQYGGAGEELGVAAVNAVLGKHGVDFMSYKETIGLRGRLVEKETDIVILPYSLYREMRQRMGLDVLEDTGNAILVYPTSSIHITTTTAEPWNDRVQIGGKELEFTVIPDKIGRILNPAKSLSYNLIVSDALYGDLLEQAAPEHRAHISLWVGNWRTKGVRLATLELQSLFSGEETHLSMTCAQYMVQVSTMGVLVFIGCFVSLVFVAACFSLLYSRLFTDIDEDRKYARRLQQIGVTNKELRGQALWQMAVIFFLPFVVGLVHSTFAMRALGTLTRRTVLQYGWGAALLFLFLFGALFIGTVQLYWRSLCDGLERGARSTAF